MWQYVGVAKEKSFKIKGFSVSMVRHVEAEKLTENHGVASSILALGTNLFNDLA